MCCPSNADLAPCNGVANNRHFLCKENPSAKAVVNLRLLSGANPMYITDLRKECIKAIKDHPASVSAVAGMAMFAFK